MLSHEASQAEVPVTIRSLTQLTEDFDKHSWGKNETASQTCNCLETTIDLSKKLYIYPVAITMKNNDKHNKNSQTHIDISLLKSIDLSAFYETFFDPESTWVKLVKEANIAVTITVREQRGGLPFETVVKETSRILQSISNTEQGLKVECSYIDVETRRDNALFTHYYSSLYACLVRVEKLCTFCAKQVAQPLPAVNGPLHASNNPSASISSLSSNINNNDSGVSSYPPFAYLDNRPLESPNERVRELLTNRNARMRALNDAYPILMITQLSCEGQLAFHLNLPRNINQDHFWKLFRRSKGHRHMQIAGALRVRFASNKTYSVSVKKLLDKLDDLVENQSKMDVTGSLENHSHNCIFFKVKYTKEDACLAHLEAVC